MSNGKEQGRKLAEKRGSVKSQGLTKALKLAILRASEKGELTVSRRITTEAEIVSGRFYRLEEGSTKDLVLVMNPNTVQRDKKSLRNVCGFTGFRQSGHHAFISFTNVGIPALGNAGRIEFVRDATEQELAWATVEVAYHSRENRRERTFDILDMWIDAGLIEGAAIYGSMSRWIDGIEVNDADVFLLVCEEVLLAYYRRIAELRPDRKSKLGIHSRNAKIDHLIIEALSIPQEIVEKTEDILRGRLTKREKRMAQRVGNTAAAQRTFTLDGNLACVFGLTPEHRRIYNSLSSDPTFLNRIMSDMKEYDRTTRTLSGDHSISFSPSN